MELLIFHYFLNSLKKVHYAGVILDASTIALCPKLCRHNVSNPGECYLITGHSLAAPIIINSFLLDFSSPGGQWH